MSDIKTMIINNLTDKIKALSTELEGKKTTENDYLELANDSKKMYDKLTAIIKELENKLSIHSDDRYDDDEDSEEEEAEDISHLNIKHSIKPYGDDCEGLESYLYVSESKTIWKITGQTPKFWKCERIEGGCNGVYYLNCLEDNSYMNTNMKIKKDGTSKLKVRIYTPPFGTFGEQQHIFDDIPYEVMANGDIDFSL